MAADPRITSLRRSERAVWRFLSLQADDDGVIRRHLATRYLARRVEYSEETVRAAVRVLKAKGLARSVPGDGRTRSLYSVPAVLGARIADPEPPAPSPDPAPAADTQGSSTGSSPAASTASAAAASGSSQQTEIPVIPAQSGHNGTTTERESLDNTLLPNRFTAEDVPPSFWCDSARLMGRPHKNTRCCHTTPRALRIVEGKLREAARVAERKASQKAAAEDRQADAATWEDKADRIKRGAAAARSALRKTDT